MQNKLIAAGAYAFGALTAWALTADVYEQKLAAKDAYILALRDRPIGRLFSVAQTEMGLEAKGLLFDDTQSEFRQSVEAAATERARLIENGELKSISLDSEIGPHGGSVTVDEFPRGDGADEASDTDDVEDALEVEDEAVRTNLQALIDSYTANADDVEEFVTVSEHVEDKRYDPPLVISKSLYAWDEDEGDEFDKLTVTYYPNDRVVLDEDDEVMLQVDRVLGWKNLNRFGDDSGDADVVFIRNRNMRTDYEVVRETEQKLPLHVKYGMDREEFEQSKASGVLRLREEDQ